MTFYVHDWRKRRMRRLTETLAGEDLSMSLAHWQPLPPRAR
jgi:hypothetical protein